MQSVQYSSTIWYDCETSVEAIICIDSSLTALGRPYIEGTVTYQNYCINTSTNPVTGCQATDKLYNYSIAYDEGQLADPNTPLTLAQIDGFHIKDCLFTYIDYWINYCLTETSSPSSSPSASPSPSPSSSPSASPSESPSASPSESPSASPSASPSSSPSSS